MSFEKQYAAFQSPVEALIKKYPFGVSTVERGARYSLELPGKRVRPVMLMAAARQTRKKGARSLGNPVYAAVALEMVHTFSLMHDDLPCIDNATLRRGKKCVHKVFGEAQGLLAGDLLLNEAFRLVSQSYPAELAGRLVKILAAVARDLIVGEACDVEADFLPVKKVDIGFIYQNKTARMIGAPIALGLTLAGWREAAMREQVLAAEKIGIAFQLVDDLLDVRSSAKKLGKDVGQDARKKTFLKQKGAAWCEAEALRLSKAAMKTFSRLPRPEFLMELAQRLIYRQS